jgi:hypothetical protein
MVKKSLFEIVFFYEERNCSPSLLLNKYLCYKNTRSKKIEKMIRNFSNNVFPRIFDSFWEVIVRYILTISTAMCVFIGCLARRKDIFKTFLNCRLSEIFKEINVLRIFSRHKIIKFLKKCEKNCC